MKNNKGFTLIEVLAVIVLLGIIMSVAIVAISGYVEESKLKTYVNIAKEYIDIASIEIAKNEIVARDKNTVYYINPSKYHVLLHISLFLICLFLLCGPG